MQSSIESATRALLNSASNRKPQSIIDGLVVRTAKENSHGLALKQKCRRPIQFCRRDEKTTQDAISKEE
jgi:hypothetical protein